MRDNLFILGLMLIAVPLAGELKFHPFQNDFRVSFGTPAFFFFLLWIRTISPVISGILVGIAVTLLRISLEWFFIPAFPFQEALGQHFPAFVYYSTYGLFFHLVKINRYHHRPLLIGGLGVGVEIIASLAELSVRYPLSDTAISFSAIYQIVIIAVIRSFFVLGFFNILILRQAKLAEEEHRKRNEHMLTLVSNLYVESLHLKKTMHHAEEITKDSYELYRSLNHAGCPELAGELLKLAGQIHEIKKDNQRVYAGLSKLISNENLADYMKMEELAEVILNTNQKYALMLGKDIQFELKIQGEHPPYFIYAILSIINNLVANSIEAIEKSGQITLSADVKEDVAEFQVADNGPGISKRKQQHIFQPGFTTKFDTSGNPSTGIGLSYVKEVVEKWGGSVQLRVDPEGKFTTFLVRLPIISITKGKEEHALFHNR
ncbi:ATP-binding protein [Ammoniphilus sp. YIM 78166]|uniref:sensor histidine kinase n=1 Tax=Ammoniphilus sp. YIM 78166 TaxID=1644106 RepID=UPI00106F4F47|nr:ATP-binding protein [Ammoniphilus sp. YIM 78166]